jgi:DNA-binding transcriptional MerR regulator
MRIGLLAARAGVSTSRIRFYEAEGLLPPPPRRHSGYRDYDERALEIILFINRARGLGFSLAEVAAHLDSPRDQPENRGFSPKWRTRFANSTPSWPIYGPDERRC